MTKGYVALVDDDDHARVSKFKWHAQLTKNSDLVYAARSVRTKTGGSMVLMHRFILGLGCGDKHVDHIDRNPLNNQKKNLRVCSLAQNQANKIKSKNKSSVYKGVSKHSATGKWVAYVGSRTNRAYLGIYEKEMDAAHAYNVAALKVFGEFARLNPIQAGVNP